MFSRKQAAAGPPARPKAKAGAAGLSLIGAEVTIGGDVTSEGALHLDGRIDGHVRCASLCQSQSGVITGDIIAEEARIGGLVEGTVAARSVVIEASGRVAGDVAYDTITIAAGAQVEGRLARRAALAGGAADLLIATARNDGEPAASTLFSGQPTQVAAD
ncbi:bactofilin family protein [Sphingosinicella sp.]|uniref:bactofilin family protein n=1 Tax=Sphingosinicella sp. TaxID=1917971 RepID=UPI004037A92E